MTNPRIVHDAKEMAGEFYDRDRSETFRRTWPSEMEYVNTKWPHFVVAVREIYAELLGRPSVPDDVKEELYEALLDQAAEARCDGAHSPLPILKDTETFFGDRRENIRTRENYGSHARTLAQKLRTTSALSLIPAKL